MIGRQRKVLRRVFWILTSYDGKPVPLICVTVLIDPSSVTQTLKLPLIDSVPERAISLWVLSSGPISLSPLVRLASSTVGATFCTTTGPGGAAAGAAGCAGAAAAGGGAKGGGASGGAAGAGVTAGLCSGAGAVGGDAGA